MWQSLSIASYLGLLYIYIYIIFIIPHSRCLIPTCYIMLLSSMSLRCCFPIFLQSYFLQILSHHLYLVYSHSITLSIGILHHNPSTYSLHKLVQSFFSCLVSSSTHFFNKFNVYFICAFYRHFFYVDIYFSFPCFLLPRILWLTNTRVTSLSDELRVTDTSYQLARVCTLKPRVCTLKPRVKALKPRVRALKARVWALKARVWALKARVWASNPRVRTLISRVRTLISRVTNSWPSS